jgi:hypothetical protein
MLVWTLGALVLLSVFSGCALTPSYIEPEIEHMSHATQHQPFTNEPKRYGAEIASLVVGWDVHNVSIQLAEGVALDKHYAWDNSNGEIMGPREQFSARVGYRFAIK